MAGPGVAITANIVIAAYHQVVMIILRAPPRELAAAKAYTLGRYCNESHNCAG
jgi:hypothetical protein